jgi:beta-lactamase superfamily II metal-dependent hydrolase
MLDVGQGDCTIVVLPAAHGEEPSAIVFDCADAYVAERFVANHAIKRLRAVVASHLDIDHIRGVAGRQQARDSGRRRGALLARFGLAALA